MPSTDFSIETSRNAISPFQKVLTQIALELLTRDVKVLKSLSEGKIPPGDIESIKADEEYSALDWITCIKKRSLIKEGDINFLIEALETARRLDLAKMAKEYQLKNKEELPDEFRILVCSNPISEHPQNISNALQLFLAFEQTPSINTNICKRMLNASQKAINSLTKALNMSLALIKFGNHGSSAKHDTAILVQRLSKNFDITCKMKEGCYCGTVSGTSGLPDALEKIVGHLDASDVKREIPKMCILICYISQESTNLEHYRCPHGNDVIRLCHILAEHKVPLYIIGVELFGWQACLGNKSNQTEQNYFLSGITAIGGGRYFQIKFIDQVKQIIKCIIKEHVSFEKLMGTVDDVIIQERNIQNGDLNVNHLAEHLEEQLNIRSCTVDGIRINGVPLEPISQIAQRVAWADDLDDAIAAVKRHNQIKEQDQIPHACGGQHFTHSNPPTECDNQKRGETSVFSLTSRSMPQKQDGRESNATLLGKKRIAAEPLLSVSKPKHLITNSFYSESNSLYEDQNCLETMFAECCRITSTEGQPINKDAAERMVRRQITRKARYKITKC